MIGAWWLGAQAVAADGTVLSLAVESLPTDYEFTIRDVGIVTQGDEVFDLAFGANVEIRLEAPLGTRVVTSFAVELAVGNYTSAQDDRYLTLLGRLVLGYGYRVADALTLGGEVWGGAGGGALHIAGMNGAQDADVHGGIVEFGVRAVVDYALGSHWYVRGGLGWQRDQSTLQGDGLEVDLIQAGPVLSVGMGWSY